MSRVVKVNRKRALATVLTLAAAGTIVGLMMGPSEAGTAPIAGATYTLSVTNSGRCIDVPDSSKSNGALLQQWGCHPDYAWQQFTVNQAGSGVFTLSSVNSGKCVDVPTGAVAGARLQQWGCGDATKTGQQFRFTASGTGTYSIASVRYGLCLSVQDSAVNGGALVVDTCAAGATQQWSFNYVSGSTGGSRPCDLYAAGGTPCVAAHSTVRALFSAYTGSLYQVKRGSDNTTKDVTPLTAGGAANAATQDTFCAGTACLISIIYDQSGKGNHLYQAPPGHFTGPAAGGYDNLADATKAPTTVYGKKAYGVYVVPGVGYRNNKTTGVATGDNPEGMYDVIDGTHYNGGCCFDYGNAETNGEDNGNGTMEAIYFGNTTKWGSGAGDGPWVMVDMENGIYGGSKAQDNTNDPTLTHRYLTAIIKGKPHNFAIRAANAQTGGVSTYYNGVRPTESVLDPNVSGYDPMRKEGAIILGTGGDNSIKGAGTFYEGAITTGYPTDAVENAIQADIVAAGYK